MRKYKKSANSPKWLGKAVMKSLGNLAFKSFLLTCVAFSANVWGQAAESNRSGAPPDNAATATPSAQPDTAAKMPHADDTYIIGDDDVLSINVWKEQDLHSSGPGAIGR